MGSYTPEQVSTLFLAIFFLIITAGGSAFVTACWRLWAPRKRTEMEKLAMKHEADAKLADSLVTTTTRQTDLMERQTSMLHDHSQTLNVHGQILNVHSEQLRNIAEAVDAKMAPALSRHPSASTITMAPAVEVSPEGVARPVVVATEVIHQAHADEK